jgi:contact-dependent growth inhibition (CDI) system CdiI-like immunity protein
VFYIGFTTAAQVDEEGWPHALGGLELGAKSDGFAADLRVWTMREYEAQWREAVARLAAGKASSALVTSYAGPGDVIHWMRPMWRVGKTVYFQDRLVMDRDVAPPKVAEQFYAIVGERSTHSEDGTPLSEWAVPFADVLAFLATE